MTGVVRARLTAGASAALAGAMLTAGPSRAHISLDAYRPAEGRVVSGPLSAVSVTYDGTVRSGRISVEGPGGGTASTGPTRSIRRGRGFRVRLERRLSAGRYTARYVTRHTDGDTVRGSWSFRLARSQGPPDWTIF